MDQQQKNLLINAINVRLNRLEIILQENIEKDEARAVSEKDESARLHDLSDQSVDKTLLEFAKQERSQLLNNLNWAKSDEAGLCQICGNDIPIRRLLTVPTTRTCIDCADSH